MTHLAGRATFGRPARHQKLGETCGGPAPVVRRTALWLSSQDGTERNRRVPAWGRNRLQRFFPQHQPIRGVPLREAAKALMKLAALPERDAPSGMENRPEAGESRYVALIP